MPSMHLGRMVWQQGQSQAFPEFRTNRMCMRWEDFDDMVTSIQLPEEVSYINGAFGSIRLPTYLPTLLYLTYRSLCSTRTENAEISFANHEGNFPSSFFSTE